MPRHALPLLCIAAPFRASALHNRSLPFLCVT